MAQNSLISRIRSLISYHKRIGISFYPLNASVTSFFDKNKKNTPQRNSIVNSREKDNIDLDYFSADEAHRDNESGSSVNLKDISEEILSCTSCSLHTFRQVSVPGHHGLNKDVNSPTSLLIIGDYLSGTDPLLPEYIFGKEQDQMVDRMLSAIKIPRREVFITNIVKCGVGEGCQVRKEHVTSCVSYLRRQVVVLRPKLICVMGGVAAKTLLQSSQPLSRLRGILHQYSITNDLSIPVVVTYHPTYLLQNPEMKRATWDDLQLLARNM